MGESYDRKIVRRNASLGHPLRAKVVVVRPLGYEEMIPIRQSSKNQCSALMVSDVIYFVPQRLCGERGLRSVDSEFHGHLILSNQAQIRELVDDSPQPFASRVFDWLLSVFPRRYFRLD